jgi:hypothetical protein
MGSRVMGSYPAVARRVLLVCQQFRTAAADLADVKRELWNASTEIVDVDEADYRSFLQQAEGRVDMVEFTVDSSRRHRAVLQIIEEVEGQTRRYLDAD